MTLKELLLQAPNQALFDFHDPSLSLSEADKQIGRQQWIAENLEVINSCNEFKNHPIKQISQPNIDLSKRHESETWRLSSFSKFAPINKFVSHIMIYDLGWTSFGDVWVRGIFTQVTPLIQDVVQAYRHLFTPENNYSLVGNQLSQLIGLSDCREFNNYKIRLLNEPTLRINDELSYVSQTYALKCDASFQPHYALDEILIYGIWLTPLMFDQVNLDTTNLPVIYDEKPIRKIHIRLIVGVDNRSQRIEEEGKFEIYQMEDINESPTLFIRQID